jgi:hypothetical protein
MIKFLWLFWEYSGERDKNKNWRYGWRYGKNRYTTSRLYQYLKDAV